MSETKDFPAVNFGTSEEELGPHIPRGVVVEALGTLAELDPLGELEAWVIRAYVNDDYSASRIAEETGIPKESVRTFYLVSLSDLHNIVSGQTKRPLLTRGLLSKL